MPDLNPPDSQYITPPKAYPESDALFIHNPMKSIENALPKSFR
jgi:hypothetical protein